MANKSNTTANAENTKELLSIRIDEPEKFCNTLETEYITSKKLADKINALFSTVFSDYYGCVVAPNPNFPTAIDLTLYFRPSEVISSDGKYPAFTTIGSNDKNSTSLIDRLNSIDSRFRDSKAFKMTQEAAELLHEFYQAGGKLKADPKDYERNKLVGEVTETRGYNRFIMDSVIGIDINRVITKIYGSKNESGESVEYMVTPVRPIGNVSLGNSAQSMNWILSIARVSKPQIDKISSELGLLVSGGTIPVVTVSNNY